MNEVREGLDIAGEARSWVGTPYRHQASVKGQGADCLGLVRGVYRTLHGTEPSALPPYKADWVARGGEEILLHAAMTYLCHVPATGAAQPGDVLLFRLRQGMPVSHCGILSDTDRFVHAWSRRSVVETAFSRWWQRHLVSRFRFPVSKEGTI